MPLSIWRRPFLPRWMPANSCTRTRISPRGHEGHEETHNQVQFILNVTRLPELIATVSCFHTPPFRSLFLFVFLRVLDAFVLRFEIYRKQIRKGRDGKGRDDRDGRGEKREAPRHHERSVVTSAALSRAKRHERSPVKWNILAVHKKRKRATGSPAQDSCGSLAR